MKSFPSSFHLEPRASHAPSCLPVSVLLTAKSKPPSLQSKILNSEYQPGFENHRGDNQRQTIIIHVLLYVTPPEMPRPHPQSIYISHHLRVAPSLQLSSPSRRQGLCALPPNHLNLIPKKMIPLHARRLAGRHARHGRDAYLGVDVEHAARAARRPQVRGGRLPAVVAEVEAVERAVKVKLLGLLCS